MAFPMTMHVKLWLKFYQRLLPSLEREATERGDALAVGLSSITTLWLVCIIMMCDVQWTPSNPTSFGTRKVV